jgi:signal transduction histidine kinase
MRVKDKTFNANVETQFDRHLGAININAQDIGRVLLNLLNNAFYSVNEKKRQLNEAYQPTVTVSTKKLDGKIEISIRDNGAGISDKVMNKIFQPFFTTKPAGQGTGLGLSLSYDIITKEHGGELNVETKEGEYARFFIRLPAYPNY